MANRTHSIARRAVVAAWLAAWCVSLAAPVFADVPLPRLSRLKPLGAAAGGQVEVQLDGPDLDELKTLIFARPGFTVEPIEKNKFRISVSPDVPAGTYDCFAMGKFGLSNARLFAVSRGLTETAEKEPNNALDQATPIEVNSAIAGEVDGNNIDCFRFTAKQGQRITLDLFAARLDSPLDGNLILKAADGRVLASNGDYYGRDPFLDYVFEADGEYVAVVHDLAYQGGHPYRLVVSDLPHVENAFGRAVQVGQATEVTFFGRNLGPGSQPAEVSAGGPKLEQLVLRLESPPAEALTRFLFSQHPTGFGADPTCAMATCVGFQAAPPRERPVLNSVPLFATRHAVQLEQEPNDERTAATKIQLPACVSARFGAARDGDWYTSDVPEGGSGQYAFTAYCERLAGRADPYLLVLDAEGKEIGDFDDYGSRQGAFDGHGRDPFGMVNLTEKKTYFVLVKDRYSRGDGRCQYVLAIERDPSRVFVSAIHSTPQEPSSVNIPRGGTAYLDLILQYEAQTRPAVSIEARNLPPGVHADVRNIGNNNRGICVLWADRNAAEVIAPFELVAKYQVGEVVHEVPVLPSTRVRNGAPQASRPLQSFLLAVHDSAPFTLRALPAALSGVAGSTIDVKVIAERYSPDCQAAIQINPLYLPNRFQSSGGVIPAGQNEVTIQVQIRDGGPAPAELVHFIGETQIPYAKSEGMPKSPQRFTSAVMPFAIEVLAKGM